MNHLPNESGDFVTWVPEEFDVDVSDEWHKLCTSPEVMQEAVHLGALTTAFDVKVGSKCSGNDVGPDKDSQEIVINDGRLENLKVNPC